MQGNFKTGLIVGTILVAAASFWLSTRDNLSIKSRFLRTHNTKPSAQPEICYQQPAETKAEKIPLTIAENKIRIHIVEKGQTLSSIANMYYGHPADYRKILEANKIKDANKITPGMNLIIPN